MEKKIIPSLYILALSLLCLPTLLPLLNPGLYTMHDNTQVVRILQMQKALTDGMFPVRWVNDLGYGYGYPIFNFYAPLVYYIGALISFFTGPLAATKITIGIAVVGSAFSMYLATSRFFTRPAALAASITYLYFPYHAVNIYVRGAIAETLAYALLPLVFYGIFRLHKDLASKKPTRVWLAPTMIAVSFAAVALSHNLTSVMLIVSLVPTYIIGLLTTQKKKSFTLLLAASLLIGFGISAFYTIPALLEMSYTNVMGQLSGGAIVTNNFICPTQLWSSPWGYGGSIPGCIDGLSFALGKNNIALVILSGMTLGGIYYTKKERKNIFPIVTAFTLLLIGVLMTLEYSKFGWEILPGLKFIQYPWRFLMIVALATSFIVASGVWAVSKVGTKWALVLSIMIILSQLYIHQDIFKAQAYDMTTNEKYTSREYITFFASKISDEYLPQGFIKPNNESQVPTKRLTVVKGDATITITKDTTKTLQGTLNASSAAVIKIEKAPFPAWRLKVDSNQAQTHAEKNGITFTVTPGTHTFEYSFVSTRIEMIANLISIASVITLIAGIIAMRKKK